jgi:PAS domain S-box-containing protein
MDEEMVKKDYVRNQSSGTREPPKQPVNALNVLEDGEKYQAVFQFAGDVILLVDDKGIITDANNKLVEIGGYQREEFIGKNISTLAGMMTAQSKTKVLKNFKKRIAGAKIPPYEVELLKKNGEELVYEINAQPLTKAGRLIGDLVILRDITGRKKPDTPASLSSWLPQSPNPISLSAVCGWELMIILPSRLIWTK